VAQLVTEVQVVVVLKLQQLVQELLDKVIMVVLVLHNQVLTVVAVVVELVL